ncbi:MAG TPA: xanthine dehydrogenase family protein molybdopterin-binding subunit [Pyrinomonadaceae bacterium]|jgi:xanthine dehydrogenase YagR molybdenum-binding subunit|nr:xanthine dehydrogenase family protein molybdopterin-binding subunit [Pyrinomonadaceae bacterium]
MQQQPQAQPSPTPKPKKKIRVPRVIDGVEQMIEIEVDADSGPGWGPNNKHTLLNHRYTRVDGPLKATGTARYTYDQRLPGMLYARILRCPHAHARVTSLDTDAASKIPGVKAIIQAPLTELRFAGAPVAAVAAATPEIAGDALRAIKVNYDVLPHVVHAATAIRPDAPKVLAEEENLKEAAKNGDPQKAEAAFGTADAIVEGEYISARIHHACLETHGMVVDYRGGDTATIYASTQGTFTIGADAASELGLTESAVTVSVEHMGGGFGSKFGLGLEGMLACRLSKQTKSPVKLMFTRYDEFVMAGNRSGSWQKLKAGVKKDGTIVALNARQYRLGGLGPGSQAGQPYIYRMGDTYREIYALHTNEDSSVAMRAPGHPQASFAVESLMDELAYKIKMDPVEFRKKNLRDEVYYRQLDRAAREIGWSRRNPIAGGNAGPFKRGMGCAVGTWGGGGNNQCKVAVTISRDGTVDVAVGTQDLGTGTRTYTRAIVAEELGLTIKDVKERIGNSKLGAANPSGGSTTAPSLSPSVKDAAIKARMMMAERVAPLLNNPKPEEVVFSGGNVSANGKSLSWQQATASLPAAGITSHGEWRADLQARGVHGVCFAEVEVDVETGHVKPIKMVHIQDGGLPLNRLTMESQINGGMIQSLGMALWEGRVMDAHLGMMLNPGFGDYKLPGTLEMPEMVPLIDDDDKREAVIGIAEGCIIPAVGALVNAVFNACGVRVRELPVTPDKILMGLSKGTQITQI